MEGPNFEDIPFEPYDVECARCGITLSCEDAMIEEGDEWECFPCWERLNKEEAMKEIERYAPHN